MLENFFAGRVAVVTGGASGLGRAVAEALAALGGSVGVADVQNAQAVANDLVRTHGVQAYGSTVDVSQQAEVEKFITEVAEKLGKPAVVVTMAGGSLGTKKELEHLDEDAVDLVIDVNLKGTIYTAVAAAEHMEAGGAVVTVSSIGGRQPSPVSGVPYAGSKAGVIGVTRRLAQMLGPKGIRVNCVAPGLFLTDRLQAVFDAMSAQERDQVMAAIPLARFPEIEEIVQPILFLAGPTASYITGVTLDVNGGRFMP